MKKILLEKVRIPFGVIDMQTKKWLNKAIYEGQNVVEDRGFEPLTFWLPAKCSPS